MDRTSINHHASNALDKLKKEWQKKVADLTRQMDADGDTIFLEYARLITFSLTEDQSDQVQSIEYLLKELQDRIRNAKTERAHYQVLLKNLDSLIPESFEGIEKYLD